MLDLKNEKVLNKEINKIKKAIENCNALITLAILEEQLEYLMSKKK